tara:strand:+ start:569 stop:1027 length:459 start_codon:yes stop_codon:yes gene_type:complete
MTMKKVKYGQKASRISSIARKEGELQRLINSYIGEKKTRLISEQTREKGMKFFGDTIASGVKAANLYAESIQGQNWADTQNLLTKDDSSDRGIQVTTKTPKGDDFVSTLWLTDQELRAMSKYSLTTGKSIDDLIWLDKEKKILNERFARRIQ